MMKHIDPAALAARIDAHAAEAIAEARANGFGFCVMQGHDIIYNKYHGVADHQTGRPVDDTTLYRLASMSKPVTAVATLIQVSRGLIDLDEPVKKLIPSLDHFEWGELDADGNVVIRGRAKTDITPRQLLTHTSGIGSMPIGDQQFARMTAEDKLDIAHVVDHISHTVLGFEPGSMQTYSPVWAFDVLARLVELTSGMDYATFLKRHVFDPCGMTDTTFAPTDDQWARMVEMHTIVEENGTARNDSFAMAPGQVFGDIPTSWCSGGAGLASTMPDYLRFATMLLRGGVTEDGRRLLPAEYIRQMGTCQVSEAIMPGPERWGLGVRVILSGHPWMPEHCFGWSGAYGSHFWVDPDNDLVAIHMRNSLYGGGAGSPMACQFEKDVYDYKESL